MLHLAVQAAPPCALLINPTICFRSYQTLWPRRSTSLTRKTARKNFNSIKMEGHIGVWSCNEEKEIPISKVKVFFFSALCFWMINSSFLVSVKMDGGEERGRGQSLGYLFCNHGLGRCLPSLYPSKYFDSSRHSTCSWFRCQF